MSNRGNVPAGTSLTKKSQTIVSQEIRPLERKTVEVFLQEHCGKLGREYYQESEYQP
jgi:hypothetical protein